MRIRAAATDWWCAVFLLFFFSSRRRHTRCGRDWSSDVCSSDLIPGTRVPSDWRKRQSDGTRVPGMCFEVVAILVRFAAVENRALQLEPPIGETTGQDAKTDMRGILKVMRQCG